MDKRDWYFKKGDQDINPSFPHLHCKTDNLKMDIYNGDIYRNKILVSTLSDKDFIKLWSDQKFINAVKEIRKTYPYGVEKLPPIPNIKDIKNLRRNSSFE